MNESLYSLLQDAARRHADRSAVEFAGERLTYAELVDRADRLGTLFADHGVQPGERAAFVFRKSIDAIVALFALIRCGATYVPLDPAWPQSRIEAICNKANIDFWIGSGPPPESLTFRAAFASDAGESETAPIEAAREHPPSQAAPSPPADGIANVLYTSGSTGEPKGVQITARSLLHFSSWAVAQFGLIPEDRLANHAAYNFDLSTLDIFAAVRAAACMLPVPETTKMLPYQAAKFIADRSVSIWYSVPTALAMMQEKLAAHDVSCLRHVIFAGEVMHKSTLRELARRLPQSTLTNLYGPTETNVCTFYRVQPEDLDSDEPLPIGRPISETRLWIVDEEGRAIEGTEPGELLVAGPTVSNGYFGDAELTRRKLVPAPDGAGMAYRTGDRVSRGADGNLLFHGRIDRMLKCRGHRIEPGEIEASICTHPAVLEAAVIGSDDPQSGVQLVAHVATPSSHKLTAAELAAHCRQRLPQYMIPDQWQISDALPHTDRGKIDLQALARLRPTCSPQ